MSAPPTIPVTVELGGELASLADDRGEGALARSLTRRLRRLIEAMGLPGVPQVAVSRGPGGRALQVRVGDRVVPYPPELLLRTWLAVLPDEPPDPVDPSGEEGFPDGWLGAHFASVRAREHLVPPWFRDYIERAVYEIIRARPSSLLNQAQVSAYLGRGGSGYREQELVGILGFLLDVGVSLKQKPALLKLLAQGAEMGRPSEDTAEAAFSCMKAPSVGICAEPRYLAALLGREERVTRPINAADSELADLAGVIEHLYRTDRGVRLPPLEWVPSRDLPPRMIGIRVNHRLSVPTQGLAPGEVLVDRTPEWFEEHRLEARQVIHPITRAVLAAIPREQIAALQEPVTMWGPGEFALLVLVSEVTSSLRCLLGLDEALEGLARIDQVSPMLVSTALRYNSLGDVTRILRELLTEGLPINNLKLVLEGLLDLQSAEGDPGAGNWRNRYERARHAYARIQRQELLEEAQPPTILLVQAEGNGGFQAGEAWDDEEAQAVRDLLWTTLRTVGGQGRLVLATEPGARPALRWLVAPEFTDVPVLERSEIPDEFPAPHVLPV